MTRNTNITYEEVADAVRKIQSLGETPTILRVKDELGNRGSTTVISKLVREFKENQNGGGGSRAVPSSDASPISAPESESQEMAVKADDSSAVQEAPPKRPRHDRNDRHERFRNKNRRDKNPEGLPNSDGAQESGFMPSANSASAEVTEVLPSRVSSSEPVVAGAVSEVAPESLAEPELGNGSGGRPNHAHPHRRQNHSHSHQHSNQQGHGQRRHGKQQGHRQHQNQNRQEHFKDRRSSNMGPHTSGDMPAPYYPQEPYAEFEREVIVSENLETMSENQLVTKIRKLESMLNKEQSRTEAAEKMASEAKQYAEVIKNQAGLRVAEVKQSMEVLIEQLRTEAEQIKKSAAQDLKYYRDQLEKANVLIAQLLQNK